MQTKLVTAFLAVILLSGCVSAVTEESGGMYRPFTQQERCLLVVVGCVAATFVLASSHAGGKAKVVLSVIGVVMFAVLAVA